MHMRYNVFMMNEWMLYALLAAIAAAVVGVFSKIGVVGVDPTIATAIRGISIALTMAIVAVWLGKVPQASSIPMRSLFFLILTGVAGGLSWLWGFMALQSGGEASLVNAIDRLSLVFLLVLATIFLGEKLTWMKALGALVVSLGVFLMTTPLETLRGLFARMFS